MSVHFHQSHQHVADQTNIGEVHVGSASPQTDAQAIAHIDELLRQIKGSHDGEAPFVQRELLHARAETAAGQQTAAASRLERTRNALSDAGALASVASALGMIAGLLAG